MNCHEFRRWLSELETTHDRSLGQNHLLECAQPACQAAWEEFLLVEEALRHWKHDVPAVDLLARIWPQIEAELSPGNQSVALAPVDAAPANRSRPAGSAGSVAVSKSRIETRPTPHTLVPLAMSLAVLATIVWGFWSANRGITPGNDAGLLVRSPADEEPQADPPLRRISLASVQLAQQTSALVADAALLTVHDPADLEDGSRPISIWASRMSQQLEPIGRNFNNALEYLDRVIPDMSSVPLMPTG